MCVATGIADESDRGYGLYPVTLEKGKLAIMLNL